MNAIGYNYFKSQRKTLPIDHRWQSMNDEERAKEAKRIHFISKIQDEDAKTEEERWAANGICPICHIHLPNSGECDCGYRRKYIGLK